MPPDRSAEMDLDEAITDCLPELADVASEALVDAARRSSGGLAPLLAAAHLAAERAASSGDVEALVRAGCVTAPGAHIAYALSTQRTN